MTTGNVVAIAQTNIKRMLAYSSIAHAGYLLIALVAANNMGVSGTLFYILAYIFMNIGAFAIVIVLSQKGDEFIQINDYAGAGIQTTAFSHSHDALYALHGRYSAHGGFCGEVLYLQRRHEIGLCRTRRDWRDKQRHLCLLLFEDYGYYVHEGTHPRLSSPHHFSFNCCRHRHLCGWHAPAWHLPFQSHGNSSALYPHFEIILF